MNTALVLGPLVAAALVLLYLGRGWLAWVVPLTGALAWWGALAGTGGLWRIAAVAGGAMALVTGISRIRRAILTRPLLPLVRAVMPRISETERAALEAGTVWFDRDLFSGAPDWHRLARFPVKPLSPKEQAFLDGPVEELCRSLDDWQVNQARDLPPEAWKTLQERRFMGMIIPEESGGLGFSAQAHSRVVVKLGSRNVAACVTTMVPNSLGPAELLLHYGTDAQRAYYLPRLARGEEIPCFALTEPSAGSDAAAQRSTGVVARGTFEGKEVLGMRLDWEKRYTTLGPVATVLGLAFRLTDPDRLLGGDVDVGITCALVPANLPGVQIGRRHDVGIPFQNGPNSGKGVFVPLEFIIGGPAMAGKGWKMLMECLAAGRSISLPSMATGAAQVSTRVVGAYASIRKQFDLPIGRFEGIEERLARIGGLTYLMDAARWLTAGAVDAGEKPAVISAIVKCWLTECMRVVVGDALDVRAGAGVCRGPRNILAGAWEAIPTGITVEGANILTRCMIVYGQGAIRAHPFVRDEIEASSGGDAARLDRALFGHVNHALRNALRAPVHALTGGRLVRAPGSRRTRRYFRALTRQSAAFATLSEAAMALLGADLKRRECITGRFADALAWMYLASASLKRFLDDKEPETDVPAVSWACEHALYQTEQALCGILDNFPNRPAAFVLRRLVFPLGARRRPPRDAVGAALAAGLLDGGELRRRLTAGIFLPPHGEPGLGELESALDKIVAASEIERRLKEAVRAGSIPKAAGEDERRKAAVASGLLTESEAATLGDAERARESAVQVDSFDGKEFLALR